MFQKIVPIALILGLSVALIVMGLRGRSNASLAALIPQGIAAELTFPAYLPSDLPEGFAVRPDSFRFEEGVLVYEIDVPDGQAAITVNQQARPTEYDFGEFYEKIVGATKTNSEQGELYVGTFGGDPVASLLSEQTWSIIRPQSEIDLTTLKTIGSSLRAVD
jgi:hypothetical protein